MNLGKLLAAGKSVKSGRAAASYRANKQIYLPKFGSAKNPFRSEAAKAATEASGNAAAQPLNTAVPRDRDKSAMERPGLAASPETHAARSIHNTLAPKEQKQPVSVPAREKKASDWVSKLNPASLFRSTSPKVVAKSASATAGMAKTTATQTELSLDSVKVVHNDLSDADVEIVPMKSRSGVPDVQPPKKSWEFLGERLFGVEAT